MNYLARQLITESGLFTADEEKWIMIVLRLSRAVSDFITEENEEGKGRMISLTSFGYSDSSNHCRSLFNSYKK